MKTVLQLQKLNPISTRGDINLMFASSGSAVCPTTVAGDEFRQFEFD